MDQVTWDKMTSAQQAEYLRDGEITISTQTFVDGKSKVGAAKVVLGRRAFCRGVALTGWLTDDEKTVRAAARAQIDALASDA